MAIASNTSTTSTVVLGGIHTPQEWQVDPKRVKRIAALWLERDAASGIVAHIYVAAHIDPRTAPRIAPERLMYSAHSGASNTLLAALAFCLSVDVGAVWVLDTPTAREIAAPLALELLNASDTPPVDGMARFPWLAHELSAGKHGAELAGMVVQRRRADSGKGTGIPVGVYFTWVGETWPTLELPALEWARDLDAAQRRATMAATWLEGVTLASYTLGAQIRFSTSYTGLTLMRGVVSGIEARRKRAIGRLSDARTAEVLEHAPTYLQWRSSFLARDLKPYWRYDAITSRAYVALRVYDRNWSFVTASREVPIGEPTATVTYERGTPGYYHVMAAYPPSDWPTTRPGPFHVSSETPNGGKVGAWPGVAVHDVWAWEAQIRQALQQGWQVEIEYGWQWLNRVDLRQWSSHMWTARQACRAYSHSSIAARLAEKIVKRVGVSAVGRLNQKRGRAVMRLERARALNARILSRHVNDYGELTGYADVELPDTGGRDDMTRPEWWATIISNANERTLAAIYAYAPDDTILAYVDGIYTLEPHSELEGDSGKPGGWRYKGTIEVPVDDLEQLDALSPYELVRALGRYGAHTGLTAIGALDDMEETSAALELGGAEEKAEEKEGRR